MRDCIVGRFAGLVADRRRYGSAPAWQTHHLHLASGSEGSNTWRADQALASGNGKNGRGWARKPIPHAALLRSRDRRCFRDAAIIGDALRRCGKSPSRSLCAVIGFETAHDQRHRRETVNAERAGRRGAEIDHAAMHERSAADRTPTTALRPLLRLTARGSSVPTAACDGRLSSVRKPWPRHSQCGCRCRWMRCQTWLSAVDLAARLATMADAPELLPHHPPRFEVPASAARCASAYVGPANDECVRTPRTRRRSNARENCGERSGHQKIAQFAPPGTN